LSVLIDNEAITSGLPVTFGFPSQYQGRDANRRFFPIRGSVLTFEFENIKVLIDTPEQAFGEYEFPTSVEQKQHDPFTRLFSALISTVLPGMMVTRSPCRTFPSVSRSSCRWPGGSGRSMLVRVSTLKIGILNSGIGEVAT
jgi:hypothetical protein